MRVHFIAVAGTGMGSLAGLMQAAGHEVSGSDVAFHPPMGPALERWGIRLLQGFDPAHLEPPPDLVVVGNVCRPDNPEARAAIDSGLKVTTMVGALGDYILPGTSSLVVAGTHGKTTTSAMCAWLLERAGRAPGFLIGGLPKNFDHSFQLPGGPSGGLAGGPSGNSAKRLPLATSAGASPPRPPFVIEGDEYDTAFFEKTPKFWHYRPQVAILTSIEHDHVDIYPDEASYHDAFAGFVERVPEDGLIVACCSDAKVVELVKAHGRAAVAWYALDGDELNGCSPHWLGSVAPGAADDQRFDLYAGGALAGRARLPQSGRHNLQNAVAAVAAVSQGFGVALERATAALADFGGVARRQDLLGSPRGVRVYDDFAHHPTAVRETLRGLRKRHPQGRLWAVYEPRTATACRALHQRGYAEAFRAADRVIFSPLGRDNIPEDERLDLDALVDTLVDAGVSAERAPSIDAIIAQLCQQAAPGDTVALLSNGAFGGIHQRLLAALET